LPGILGLLILEEIAERLTERPLCRKPSGQLDWRELAYVVEKLVWKMADFRRI